MHPLPDVPEGKALALSPSIWLDAVRWVSRAEHRKQRHANVMRLAEQIALRSTHAMVTDPRRGAAWDILAEECGFSRRTLAYLLAWLRERGLLLIALPGSTPRTRWLAGGPADDGLGNVASQYVQVIPEELLGEMGYALEDLEERDDARGPVDNDVPWPVETVPNRPDSAIMEGGKSPAQSRPVESLCTPKSYVHSSLSEKAFPHAGARASDAATTLPAPWRRLATPGTNDEQLRAANRLRTDNTSLRILSAKDLRSILRPYFEAGATVGWIEQALAVKPDGQRWGDIDPGRARPRPERVRLLHARVRHRLGLWLTPSGALVAPDTYLHRAFTASTVLAEQHAWAVQRAGLLAQATTDVAARAAEVRAVLAGRRTA